MLLIIGVALLATASFLLAEAATMPARQRRVAIRRAATYGRRARVAREPGQKRFNDRVVLPARDRLAGWALRLNPRMSVEAVRLKLLAAGMSGRVSATTFLAGKAGIAISGLVIGALFGSSSGILATLVLAVAFGALGFTAPDFLLSSRARSRKERVRSELPDALDILAVSVEAGLGFDGACAKLTEHTDGPLSQEFALTLGEMRIGEGRQEALKKMADRVDVPEVATFTRAIIQADQLGISLGRILRVQAADTRLRRQAAAEEKAMKAPIKMLFPTVLFIFPAMFLVILGPAFMNLSKLF